jgi:hypothetical protein
MMLVPPRRGDGIILVTPPTTVVATRLFLYGHRLYTVPFHVARLREWLRRRCGDVVHLDCHADPASRPLPVGSEVAGPASDRPAEVPVFAFGLDPDTLRERLHAAGPPSQVWITTLFAYDRDLLAATVAAIRSVFPQTPIVLGGAYASLCPDDCRAMGADEVHEGLLTEAEDGTPTRIRGDGFVVAGRGCPNRCSYCAFSRIEGAIATSASADSVAAQVAGLDREGLATLALYAPAIFRGSMAGVSEEIVSELAKFDRGVLGWAGFEPKVVNHRRAELLRRAGFLDVTVPLQTHDRELARSWGRRETLEDFETAIRTLREAGYSPMEIGSDVIIGHPDQPLDETIRTACYVWSLGITPVIFPYTWIPGSSDAARLARGTVTSAASFQPYLFPFARPGHTADDYTQLCMLSRVQPALLEVALSCLDPDGPVPGLVRRYLDEFGFAVPQWKLGVPLPPCRTGYDTFLSHPWELVLALLRGGNDEEAARFTGACSEVRTCEPAYAEIPRRFLEVGLVAQAKAVVRGALAWLPRRQRSEVLAVLDGAVADFATSFATIAPAVSRALRWSGNEKEAEAWERHVTTGIDSK